MKDSARSYECFLLFFFFFYSQEPLEGIILSDQSCEEVTRYVQLY